jgi:hypothetical protein
MGDAGLGARLLQLLPHTHFNHLRQALSVSHTSKVSC